MINIEQPPANLPPEVQSYLIRMFTQIDNALRKSMTIPVTKQEVLKPTKGQIFYFTNAYPSSKIDVPGVYFYNGTQWVHVV